MKLFLNNINNKEDKINHCLDFEVAKINEQYDIKIKRFSGGTLIYHCMNKAEFLKTISRYMGKNYLWKNKIPQSIHRYWVFDANKKSYVRLMVFVDNKWIDVDLLKDE